MRSPPEVAARTLIMGSLSFRASLEVTEHPRCEEICSRLLPWLQGLMIDQQIDPIEREILATPYRQLSSEQRNDAYWAGEGAAIYSWTLGLAPAPPPSAVNADHQSTVDRLRILYPEAREVLENAKLLASDEVPAYCRLVAATLSEMRQRRVTEKDRTILKEFQSERSAALGLYLTYEDEAQARIFLDSLSAHELQSCAGLYFVRYLATRWLFDSRPHFFA